MSRWLLKSPRVELVNALPASGPCDFVEVIAEQLPAAVICSMMGIPVSKRQFIIDRVSQLLGNTDPDYSIKGVSLGPKTARSAARELVEFGKELAADRLRNPQDDLTTALVQTNDDGESLTEAELGSFFQLLCVAGAETTRTALAWGLVALTAYPEQRELLWSNFDTYGNRAVDEIVRWATPVLFMRRTVTRAVTVSGLELEEGDKVVLLYWGANRDESVFDNPGVFDLTRNPNQHYGFGAPGPHFCLGAHLAPKEIRTMFDHPPSTRSRHRCRWPTGPPPVHVHQRDQAPRLQLHEVVRCASFRRTR
jgi:cytochrome P450